MPGQPPVGNPPPAGPLKKLNPQPPVPCEQQEEVVEEQEDDDDIE